MSKPNTYYIDIVTKDQNNIEYRPSSFDCTEYDEFGKPFRYYRSAKRAAELYMCRYPLSIARVKRSK